MTDWLRELRQTCRLLASSPGTLIVAIASLALGIGLNTAVLAVARTVLLKPLSVGDPSALRVVHWAAEEGARGINQINSSNTRDETTGKTLNSSFAYSAFETLRRAAAGRAEIFGFTLLQQANISIEHHSMVGGGMFVSGNFFSGLQVPVALGRGLTSEDDREGAEPAAVLTHGLWQRAFGSDPSAIGRTIRINGHPFTIVGVTACGYFGVSSGGFFPPAEITVALRMQPLVSAGWTPEKGSLFTTESTFWVRMGSTHPIDGGARGARAPHRQIRAACIGERRRHQSAGGGAPAWRTRPRFAGQDARKAAVHPRRGCGAGVCDCVRQCRRARCRAWRCQATGILDSAGARGGTGTAGASAPDSLRR